MKKVVLFAGIFALLSAGNVFAQENTASQCGCTYTQEKENSAVSPLLSESDFRDFR